jgi:hypothetical protein
VPVWTADRAGDAVGLGSRPRPLELSRPIPQKVQSPRGCEERRRGDELSPCGCCRRPDPCVVAVWSWPIPPDVYVAAEVVRAYLEEVRP